MPWVSSYPEMPSRKMAWDSDGTVVVGNEVDDGGFGMPRGGFPTGANLIEMTQVDKELVNGTTDAQYGSLTGPGKWPAILWALLFPEKREIDGYYWNWSQTGAFDIEYLSISKDSTNVRDGTWTPLGSEARSIGATDPDYRNTIQSNADSNVTGIYSQLSLDTKISNEWSYIDALHIYGVVTPGQGVDQLIYLDSENSNIEFSKPLDYGDIGQGSASLRKVKVKNNSGTKTAEAITVTANVLSGTSDDMWTYSIDGVNDVVSKSLGNLGPGGTQEIYIHLAVSDSYTVGLYEPRTELTVTSWT